MPDRGEGGSRCPDRGKGGSRCPTEGREVADARQRGGRYLTKTEPTSLSITNPDFIGFHTPFGSKVVVPTIRAPFLPQASQCPFLTHRLTCL